MAMDWSKLLSTRRLKPRSPSPKVEGDKRDEFDRDLDRVVYSTPFRRLQDKTQVFPLEPNDSVRTRLTHSLEVSRAASGLARDVCQWMMQEGLIDLEKAKSIETISATCGLLHDLGNPPFGHSGEIAIRHWFARGEEDLLEDLDNAYSDDFRKFEGNAQTLRLVTKLQILADFHGLNLTCGTLSAACKYVASCDAVNKDLHERSKVGFFASEREVVENIREETGTEVWRNPIAYLVEAADDAVYNAVDLEDGLKKGILEWEQLKSELRKVAKDDPAIENSIQWAEGRVEKAEVHLKGRAKESALVQYFRVRAIGKIVVSAAEAFKSNYEQIMNGEYHDELLVDSKAAALVEACRKLNRSRVYRSDETLKLELMGRRIIWDLMDLFWEGAGNTEGERGRFADKAFSLLSENYRSVFDRAKETEEFPPRYCQLQLVTDYVCGMTDTFAVELHRRLTNG